MWTRLSSGPESEPTFGVPSSSTAVPLQSWPDSPGCLVNTFNGCWRGNNRSPSQSSSPLPKPLKSARARYLKKHPSKSEAIDSREEGICAQLPTTRALDCLPGGLGLSVWNATSLHNLVEEQRASGGMTKSGQGVGSTSFPPRSEFTSNGNGSEELYRPHWRIRWSFNWEATENSSFEQTVG